MESVKLRQEVDANERRYVGGSEYATDDGCIEADCSRESIKLDFDRLNKFHRSAKSRRRRGRSDTDAAALLQQDEYEVEERVRWSAAVTAATSPPW